MEKIRAVIDEFYSRKKYDKAYQYMVEQLTQAINRNDDFIVLGLLNELMSYYRVHGMFKNGAMMATRAIAILQRLGLSESVMAATTYLNIATLYRLAGSHNESYEYFQKCLEIYEQNLNEEDERFISFYNNYSLLLQEIGKIEKAIYYSRKALCLVTNIPDSEIGLAITYTNLAQMLFSNEEKEEAMQCLEKSIHIFEEFGSDDPHYHATLATMAQRYFIEKDYEKAIELYQEVLGKIKATFGENADYKTVYDNYLYAKSRLEQKKQGGFGLKLCEDYYKEVGEPMLKEKFPDLLPFIAIGLVGLGSECLGYDDEISRDHDFGPGFCIWLPEVQYEQHGKEIQAAYDQMPIEFRGYQRNISHRGNGRVGVFSIEEFVTSMIPRLPENEEDWLYLKEQSLLMLTSGKVFVDNYGEFSKLRGYLKKYYPEGARLKKIAEAIAKMAQSGQYNYLRCIKRNDIVAANFALTEFIDSSLSCMYLLNKRYKPYYKWAFRGVERLPLLQDKAMLLKDMLQTNDVDQRADLIENICQGILAVLKQQGLTSGNDTFLEAHVDCILRKAKEGEK